MAASKAVAKEGSVKNPYRLINLNFSYNGTLEHTDPETGKVSLVNIANNADLQMGDKISANRKIAADKTLPGFIPVLIINGLDVLEAQNGEDMVLTVANQIDSVIEARIAGAQEA